MNVRTLRLLTGEALRDALRRRTILAVVVVCVLTVMGFDSCTGLWEGQAVVNGQEVDIAAFGRLAGLPMLAILSLGVIALAGLLASDELSRPLEDGTANLWLARPVSRTTWALSRLLGALLVTLGVEAILLGSGAGMLAVRQQLAPGPALSAAATCALGAATAAALAMLSSLWLPRIATLLVGAVALFLVAGGNLMRLVGAEPSGSFGLADRLGPPLLSAVVVMLAPWVQGWEPPVHAGPTIARLLLWTAVSTAALLLVFRRRDLPR